jgi:GNAT superfamily N-acetyltransferase
MALSAVGFCDGDSVMPGEYRTLRGGVGWTDPEADDALLGSALSRSWNVTARNAAGELVGLARVLDDGALYASIWDVLVDPAHQRGGIGSELFARALRQVGGRSLVALVGTAAGSPLYHRAGFVPADDRSTGMFRRRINQK